MFRFPLVGLVKPSLTVCACFLGLLACFGSNAWGGEHPLNEVELRRGFSRQGFSSHEWSMALSPLDGSPTTRGSKKHRKTPPPQDMDIRGDELMHPASTIKLVTTSAALDLLGPGHHWNTELFSDSPPTQGRIGTLYIKGDGDPTLSLDSWLSLLRALRQRDVNEIDNIVIDRTRYQPFSHHPGNFDGSPFKPYNVGPDALLVGLNSISFLISPVPPSLPPPGGNRTGASPTLAHIVPEIGAGNSGDIRIDNRILVTSEECGDWKEKLNISVQNEQVIIAGGYPALCGEKNLVLAPWSSSRHVDILFRTLWKAQGGIFSGKMSNGSVPAGAYPLYRHRSRSLAEAVRDTNKFSSNPMARMIFLALDPAESKSIDGARNKVMSWLSSIGIEKSQAVLENGSGLSRSERLTARAMVQLLKKAWSSPYMPDFMASLPIAGVDGTLQRRLKNIEATGRARLKTGSLNDVRALAGYVLDQRGTWWAVCFMVNSPNARQSTPVLDEAINRINRFSEYQGD